MKSIKAIPQRAASAVSNAYYRAAAVATVSVIGMVPTVHAADMITHMLDKGVDLLTNKWARGAGVIAIAGVGYKMKQGNLDKKAAYTTMGGIATVLGAATIYDQFTT